MLRQGDVYFVSKPIIGSDAKKSGFFGSPKIAERYQFH
jgi:hypothetical protein